MPIVGRDVGGDAFRTYSIQKFEFGYHEEHPSLKFESNYESR